MSLVDIRSIPGLHLHVPKIHRDVRGLFVKQTMLPCGFIENFHTVSGDGTIRGMHFQAPPHAHEKLVHCVHGSVLDVVLDLRRSSPTYGHHASIVLTASDPVTLLLPVGVAHGFLSLDDHSVVCYLTTTPHSPEHDAGIRWNSFGMKWPQDGQHGFIVSDRDSILPKLCDFETPFV